MPDPENPPFPPQDAIAWWESPTLKALAVATAAPMALGIQSAFAIWRALHVSNVVINPLDVVNILIAVAAGVGSGIVLWRRIKAGLDPSSPAPPIKMRVF